MVNSYPYISKVKRSKLSPWVVLNEKHVNMGNNSDLEIYHSIGQSDYVTVFAIRPDGFIPIVKQFRPAVEHQALELPGGIVDRDLSPKKVAISEIYEETGTSSEWRDSSVGMFKP